MLNHRNTVIAGWLFLSACIVQADSGGRHKQRYVVPAPHSTGSGQAGKVLVDGKLADWDLSGQIEMYVISETKEMQSGKFAVMYDQVALF